MMNLQEARRLGNRWPTGTNPEGRCASATPERRRLHQQRASQRQKGSESDTHTRHRDRDHGVRIEPLPSFIAAPFGYWFYRGDN